MLVLWGANCYHCSSRELSFFSISRLCKKESDTGYTVSTLYICPLLIFLTASLIVNQGFMRLHACTSDCNALMYCLFPRTTPKTQYTGCSVHENNNGQAAFENPMYNTSAKAVEGKAVRFDPNLNTVCTMV